MGSAKWRRDNPANDLIIQTRYRAKKKGIPMELTQRWVSVLIAENSCAATGLPFEFEAGSPWKPSIDRIDPTKGYTVENCRLVVWIFNRTKGVFTDKEIMKLAEALAQRKRGESHEP